MPLAIAAGVVSHEVPFSSFPLGNEMVISSRGCAKYICQSIRLEFRGSFSRRTSNFGVLSRLDLIEKVKSVLDKLGGIRELQS